MRVEIPPGECHTAYGGYPWAQIADILPENTVRLLKNWMYGQTMMLCDGSPELKWIDGELVEVGPPKCDRAHGGIVYEWDLDRFLMRLPVVD